MWHVRIAAVQPCPHGVELGHEAARATAIHNSPKLRPGSVYHPGGHNMPRITTLLILLALVVSMFTPRDPHAACYWDSDTLRTEAKGLPEAIDTIVGRFDRYPDLYYQMRLDRAAKALATNPDLLEELDDAAMASECSGKSDDAVAWLEKKHAVLERLKAAKGEQDPSIRITSTATSRTSAPLSPIAGSTTVQIARRWTTSTVRADLIAAAIAPTPIRFHFVREVSVDGNRVVDGAKGHRVRIAPTLRAPRRRQLADAPHGTGEQYADAEAGVRGLIVLVLCCRASTSSLPTARSTASAATHPSPTSPSSA